MKKEPASRKLREGKTLSHEMRTSCCNKEYAESAKIVRLLGHSRDGLGAGALELSSPQPGQGWRALGLAHGLSPLILTERGTEAPVSGASPKLAHFPQGVLAHDREPGPPRAALTAQTCPDLSPGFSPVFGFWLESSLACLDLEGSGWLCPIWGHDTAGGRRVPLRSDRRGFEWRAETEAGTGGAWDGGGG